MVLTAKARYATMAMAELAALTNGEALSLSIISEQQKIDKGYLEQIFAKLKAAKLVVSSKGPGGGYRLSADAEKITIADILKAVEVDLKFTKCDRHSPEGCINKSSKCIAHHVWETIEDKFFIFLQSITLENLRSGQLKGKL